MTMNCGHVFCQYCIAQWESKCVPPKKGKKSDFTCPNCREKITTQSRSLQIENLIVALFRDVDEALVKDREKLIQERKVEMEQAAKSDKKKKNEVPVVAGAANRTGAGRTIFVLSTNLQILR